MSFFIFLIDIKIKWKYLEIGFQNYQFQLKSVKIIIKYFTIKTGHAIVKKYKKLKNIL